MGGGGNRGQDVDPPGRRVGAPGRTGDEGQVSLGCRHTQRGDHLPDGAQRQEHHRPCQRSKGTPPGTSDHPSPIRELPLSRVNQRRHAPQSPDSPSDRRPRELDRLLASWLGSVGSTGTPVGSRPSDESSTLERSAARIGRSLGLSTVDPLLTMRDRKSAARAPSPMRTLRPMPTPRGMTALLPTTVMPVLRRSGSRRLTTSKSVPSVSYTHLTLPTIL